MLSSMCFYLVFVRTGAQAAAEDDQQVDTRGIKGHDFDICPAGRMGFHPPGQSGQVYFRVAGPAELKRYPDLGSPHYGIN